MRLQHVLLCSCKNVCTICLTNQDLRCLNAIRCHAVHSAKPTYAMGLHAFPHVRRNENLKLKQKSRNADYVHSLMLGLQALNESLINNVTSVNWVSACPKVNLKPEYRQHRSEGYPKRSLQQNWCMKGFCERTTCDLCSRVKGNVSSSQNIARDACQFMKVSAEAADFSSTWRSLWVIKNGWIIFFDLWCHSIAFSFHRTLTLLTSLEISK